jgi:hypothetical protein
MGTGMTIVWTNEKGLGEDYGRMGGGDKGDRGIEKLE